MQEKALEIEKVEDPAGGVVEIHLHGPLLLGNFFQLQSMVRSDTSHLTIINVADMPYIDSAGIGCLVSAHVSREGSGRKLVIVGAHERLLTSLKVTKVDQLFSFASSVEQARAQATRA